MSHLRRLFRKSMIYNWMFWNIDKSHGYNAQNLKYIYIYIYMIQMFNIYVMMSTIESFFDNLKENSELIMP